ncbi:hypothetical protein DUNSADRAFT_8539 [Dunaliella salina]|uniref:Uncharacterized protein n=1 Tax=Dunaliella salina TaxID=3046 RepID=A0ABQ7GJH2_DUNSA|nr:hypothetical protein DUNSADRAFT_8539 [Dunaliella salina]|eukprot:KAF5834715.1 hypothetical protein DUNSADRAFT_8539 [Dunaliella salina]
MRAPAAAPPGDGKDGSEIISAALAWYEHHIAWEHLLLQLQALRMEYVEVLNPARVASVPEHARPPSSCIPPAHSNPSPLKSCPQAHLQNPDQYSASSTQYSSSTPCSQRFPTLSLLSVGAASPLPLTSRRPPHLSPQTVGVTSVDVTLTAPAHATHLRKPQKQQHHQHQHQHQQSQQQQEPLELVATLRGCFFDSSSSSRADGTGSNHKPLQPSVQHPHIPESPPQQSCPAPLLQQQMPQLVEPFSTLYQQPHGQHYCHRRRRRHRGQSCALGPLSAQHCHSPQPGVLCLSYSLTGGQTAADLAADIVAIANTQAFLASLEALAPPTEAGQQPNGANQQGCLRMVSAAHPHACLCPLPPPTAPAAAGAAAGAPQDSHDKAHGLPLSCDAHDLQGSQTGVPADAENGRAAKRPCTGRGVESGVGGTPNGPLQQSVAPECLANGDFRDSGQAQRPLGPASHQDGAAVGAGAHTADLSWHSPLHGTVGLTGYGPAFAVLRFSSGTCGEGATVATGTGGRGSTQQQQQQDEGDVELELLVHWRQRGCFPEFGGGAAEGVALGRRGGRGRLRGARNDADSSSSSCTAGQVQCCVVPVLTRPSMRALPAWMRAAPPLGLRAAATPAQLAAWVHTLSAAGPVAELASALAEWVDAGATGKVLDALASCAKPMCMAATWAAGGGAVEQGADQPQAVGSGACLQGQVVHVPGYGPYQHRMLVPQACSKGSGPESLAAVTYLCIQMVCTAEGRTWLCVWVEGAAAATPAALQSVQAQLSTATGYHVVHPAGGQNKQLWVLVPNAAVQEVLSLCAKAWGSVPQTSNSMRS